MRSERNLRSVRTRVTVRDVHSDVRMNTDLMHTYLVHGCSQGSLAVINIIIINLLVTSSNKLCG